MVSWSLLGQVEESTRFRPLVCCLEGGEMHALKSWQTFPSSKAGPTPPPVCPCCDCHGCWAWVRLAGGGWRWACRRCLGPAQVGDLRVPGYRVSRGCGGGAQSPSFPFRQVLGKECGRGAVSKWPRPGQSCSPHPSGFGECGGCTSRLLGAAPHLTYAFLSTDLLFQLLRGSSTCSLGLLRAGRLRLHRCVDKPSSMTSGANGRWKP